jgi:hypothetical protein
MVPVLSWPKAAAAHENSSGSNQTRDGIVFFPPAKTPEALHW